MGDARRFDLFATLVESRFSRFHNSLVADVAGGKGYLQAALRERGFRRVITIDKRHRLAKGRPGQKYAYFRYDGPEDYRLVLGMHPDEATDHIVLYAARHGVPFVICPCCIKPDAVPFWETYSERPWLEHLCKLASRTHTVERTELPMVGKRIILIGQPR
jgi:hypothetical protein